MGQVTAGNKNSYDSHVVNGPQVHDRPSIMGDGVIKTGHVGNEGASFVDNPYTENGSMTQKFGFNGMLHKPQGFGLENIPFIGLQNLNTANGVLIAEPVQVYLI